jgi:hypothetical protein
MCESYHSKDCYYYACYNSIERTLIGINNLFRLLSTVLAYHDTEVCSQSNSVAEVRALEVLAWEWTQNGQRSWCDRLSFTTHFVGRSYFLKMKHNDFLVVDGFLAKSLPWIYCCHISCSKLQVFLLNNLQILIIRYIFAKRKAGRRFVNGFSCTGSFRGGRRLNAYFHHLKRVDPETAHPAIAPFFLYSVFAMSDDSLLLKCT